jgi:hypothetical protein
MGGLGQAGLGLHYGPIVWIGRGNGSQSLGGGTRDAPI